VRCRLFVPLLLTALVLTTPAAAASTYRPPVAAPVVDGFRLPYGPYGAGNRGLEYATTPGQPVRAIGDGLVVFAGKVAGNLAVTVLHPDGLRSSYSYLAEALVKVGARVTTGTVIGTAGERLHLGVRAGGSYLDPATLFTSTGVHLVPLEDDPPAAVDPPERRELDHGLWGWLGAAGTLARRS
jgi:murein DD-endopeptidase MepM/ murein hydrolase activator NlpD